MYVNVTTADGHTYEASCYKHDDGAWWCTIHNGYPHSMHVDLRRDYDDSDDCKVMGWTAKPDRESARKMPQHAALQGAGKTMGQALVPFFEVVREADRCAAAQAAFYFEQKNVIDEICACFEPAEALRLLDRVRASLVLDWHDWNDFHGGCRKNGAGGELARVSVPVDGAVGVVIWTATKWETDGHYRREGGYLPFDDSESWNWSKPNRKAAVMQARELADAWLREQGVLP